MPVMRGKVVTKGGKPFQSKLAPHEAEVKRLKAEGASTRTIAAEMSARHGLQVSHNAVASFLRTHGAWRRNFLDGIGEVRKMERMDYSRELWAYQRAVGVAGVPSPEFLPEPARLVNLRSLLRR